LVQPVLADLFAERLVDRFFFVRYELGGPLVRLRLRLRPGASSDQAEGHLVRAAADFFSRWPSPVPVDREVIRTRNRSILAGNPLEDDDSVYPDNTLLAFPFLPETERYGGAGWLERSLDFFAVSSAEALGYLAAHAEKPWSRQLPVIFRLLARQAWSLSPDETTFLSLVSYAEMLWGEAMAPIAARGDREYERHPGIFRDLLAGELGALPQRPGQLGEAACRLAWELGPADPAIRRRVALSQMHMTANRLGLSNPEEAYLGRLLRRASQDLPQTVAPLLFSAGPPAGRLQDLLDPVFLELVAHHPQKELRRA
jgi:hypothetical protein